MQNQGTPYKKDGNTIPKIFFVRLTSSSLQPRLSLILWAIETVAGRGDDLTAIVLQIQELTTARASISGIERLALRGTDKHPTVTTHIHTALIVEQVTERTVAGAPEPRIPRPSTSHRHLQHILLGVHPHQGTAYRNYLWHKQVFR